MLNPESVEIWGGDNMIKYFDKNGVEITNNTQSVFYNNGKDVFVLHPCFYDVHTLHTTKQLQGFEDTMSCGEYVYFVEDYKMEKIDDNTFKLLEIEVIQ